MNTAVLSGTAVTICIFTFIFGLWFFNAGYSAGENNVACTPDDLHLQDLLECYADREVLQAQASTDYAKTIYDEGEEVMNTRVKCRNWYADERIREENNAGVKGLPVWDEYTAKFTELCRRKHPMPEGVEDPWK